MTEYMLNVPFVSRYGAGGARLDCGACCAAMLLEAMAQPASPEEITAVAESGRTAGRSGCRLSPTALIRGAGAGSLTMFKHKGRALDDLKRLIDDGQPPIVRLKYGDIPDRLERRCTAAHYVVVVGYDEQLGLLFVNDPHYPEAGEGDAGGHRRAYAYQIFLDAWADFDFSVLAPVPVAVSASAPVGEAAALSFSFTAGLGNVWVVAPLGLLVRPQADTPAPQGAPGIPFGQRLTALSQESARDAKGFTWRQIQADYGVTGWVAASAGGNRYLSDAPPLEPYSVYVLDTAPVRQAGGLSIRETRDIESPLRERIAIGGQLTVYQRVTEADGTPWLWVKSSAGTFGWAREKTDNVVMIGSSAPVGPTPTPISGFLISQPEVRQLPLASATLLSAPPGASAEQRRAVAIWNDYGGMLEPLAAKLGFDPAVAVAVVAAESGGRGFGADGRMIIRFENHVFWSNWGKYNPDTFNTFFQFDRNRLVQGHMYRSDSGASWRECHSNQTEEWNVLGVAQRLNDRAAKLSISMGLAQIMGFNHSMVGYPSVEAMFDAFNSEERIQLIGFFDFVKSRKAIPALQARDFVQFALLYNGKGQENVYSAIIQRYYDAFHTIKP